MSIHLAHFGIHRTKPKHRAIDAVTDLRAENHQLRAQVINAGQAITALEHQLADVRGKRAEAEQVVVCLSADLGDRTEERDQLRDEVAALRARLAPYLAADANANKITVPPSIRDTDDGADQATARCGKPTASAPSSASPTHRPPALAPRPGCPATPTRRPRSRSASSPPDPPGRRMPPAPGPAPNSSKEHAMQYTQDALFPDTEIVGSGQPMPWHPDEEAPETAPFQIEALFDEEPQQ
ncbi:hypothetical protein K388_05043 [Streptomyces sp. KhCrAH-43]|uniref:hypothetical protein n=1 Tax=unclassified Streptomyces TaxID=2593676 RepID=UPI00049102C3|nr:MULTISPECIES: hypothetical protein [unclassified Streptomyces]MYX67310.1 hypothetical protein [Streptomyces sp. SID8373]RAJ54909.1 hypothetical protein K388_05043 [Streptomyces sp. KhCrAH-43]